MNATSCFLCGTITDTKRYASGLVDLCTKCAPRIDPLDHTLHNWRGTGNAGTWWCTGCGRTLGSQEISTAIKESPPPTVDYC